MKLTELYYYLRSDLASIEKELESVVRAEHIELQKASHHLLKAGGKRIRPVFVLLSGKFGNNDMDKVRKVAVTLELIHMATLVHDDVIDNAEMRRGRKTIKSKWDNRVAMYTGDYLFAKALELISEIDNPKAHRILSNALVEMCIGEIEQIRDLFAWQQNLRNYLRRIKRKTALLIAVSCSLGAAAAQVKGDITKNLYNFGYFVGMSFQITDDILDLVGTEKQIGKPAGSDLRQGNMTLPVLYALQDGENREEIVAYINSDRQKDKQWQHVLKSINESGGIEFSQRLSEAYLQKAYAALAQLPDIKAKDSLYEIAKYIGQRKY